MKESTGILQAALQTAVHIWEPGNPQRPAVAVACWELTSTTWSSSPGALHPKVPQGKRVHWLEDGKPDHTENSEADFLQQMGLL